MNRGKALKSIYFLLASGILVSVYAIAQRLGIDKDIWVQDVINRVFSSLGQPNWLAAWIVAILPVAWAFGFKQKMGKKYFFWTILSLVFFLVLLLTKSRSGLLGLLVADVAFWALLAKASVKKFFVWHLSALAVAFSVGTIWTPSLGSLINRSPAPQVAPEPGGTESGDIRKIVWKGALETWKANPILGTGVETFAYSYYGARPAEHNLTSEWEYLYNKAHNEYLNFAANSGSLGLLTYLGLILACLLSFKRNLEKDKSRVFNLGLTSGFLSILVSNFFGFSVVAVALAFFLFPAISQVLTAEPDHLPASRKNLTSGQKFGVFLVFIIAGYFLFLIGRFWYADFTYAKGKSLNDSAEPFLADPYLRSAISLNPLPSLYSDELAAALASQSISWFEAGEEQKAFSLAEEAILVSESALALSPRDVSLLKSQAALYIKLAELNPEYLSQASRVFAEATLLAPTDAKIHYNLGLSLIRLGKYPEALSVLNQTIELKPNYRDARFALALLLLEQGKTQDARAQLLYILEEISPEDPLVEQQLEEIP
jgi:O-antigen ligase